MLNPLLDCPCSAPETFYNCSHLFTQNLLLFRAKYCGSLADDGTGREIETEIKTGVALDTGPYRLETEDLMETLPGVTARGMMGLSLHILD